jgi:hypothetical protein
MHSFTQPSDLNGVQLIEEIQAKKILVNGVPSLDSDGVLWLDIDEKDHDKVATIIENHKGEAHYKDATAIARIALLERLGISEEEAQLLK